MSRAGHAQKSIATRASHIGKEMARASWQITDCYAIQKLPGEGCFGVRSEFQDGGRLMHCSFGPFFLLTGLSSWGTNLTVVLPFPIPNRSKLWEIGLLLAMIVGQGCWGGKEAKKQHVIRRTIGKKRIAWRDPSTAPPTNDWQPT